MKTKIIAVLAIAVSVTSLVSPVRAQSPAPNPDTQDYKLTGDSLEGIGDRSAQDDFSKFFNGNNSGEISNNPRESKTSPSELRLNQPISLPNNQILLQPGQPSVNGNEALQLQLDLDNQ
ncbi:hypothetical protein [Nostoc sp. TCL26-01]|uniref:hypothetical protein n=1 Tax=Nostoc sp. TCL26-01 TaxID=2576904 RepID=UPI0015BBACD2|nr:hypothetical protein [Nostoc sp. TCL26-01]QLE56911.1 hypothetical protein FD725_16135 [Nostoc sp. TCL26-01]